MGKGRKRKAPSTTPPVIVDTQPTVMAAPAADGVFRWEFSGIAALSYEGKWSRVWHSGDVQWRVKIRTENSVLRKSLSIYLYCNEEKCEDGEEWSADGSHKLALINQIPGLKNTFASITHKYTQKATSWGYSEFIAWDTLINPAAGFLLNDKIIVVATIQVNKTTGIRSMLKFNFSTPGFGDDGIVLKIEGKKVHVGKNFLSLHSPVFAAMFFGNFAENGKKEIELKDVSHEDFIELLYVIHPSFRDVTVSSYNPLLELADRFQMKYATDAVESYLKRTKNVTVADKLVAADNYRLNLLMSHCLASYSTLGQIKALIGTPEYAQFTDATKAAILDRTGTLIGD